MCSVLLSEDPPEHTSARFRFASMAIRWDTAAGAEGQRDSNLTAHMVASAAVQETVSRVPVTSYLLRQRQERRFGGKCFFSKDL